MTDSQAILILGAGRSGTSTLTRALATLGVYLGRRFRRPVRKNPRGSFEELQLLKLSKAIRNSLGLRADSVRLLGPEDWQTCALPGLRARVRRVIEQEFSGHRVWAFKYAGTGRILPFWLDLLPEMGIRPAFAFAYRNPLSIARSRSRLNPHRGVEEHNSLEWLANVVPYFDRVRGFPTAVVDYDRLVANPKPELHRLGRLLDLEPGPAVDRAIDEFADDFLQPEWRHHTFTDADLHRAAELPPLLCRTAILLSRAARDELRLDQPEFWEAWAQIQAEHAELAPMLRLIDRLAADARRGRLWDLPVLLRLAWHKVPLLRAP